MHSTGTGQPVETQDVFFWRLAGRSAPTGLAIVHWIGCINAIKSVILRIRIFVNRKILILRIFLRKTTILRKILRIRIFMNTGPGLAEKTVDFN